MRLISREDFIKSLDEKFKGKIILAQDFESVDRTELVSCYCNEREAEILKSGFNLITIWEKDWNSNKEVILNEILKQIDRLKNEINY